MSMSSNRWYVLILATLTGMLGLAMPNMSVPVLFKEIADDLGLNVVQIGVVWSMVSLAGIFIVFISGMFIDRYGIKRVLIFTMVATGILGASRALSNDFWSLTLTTFLYGMVMPIIPVLIHRSATVWFSGRQLGMANSIIATGMALGFALGAMIGASVLSPWLGNWRWVFCFYGAICFLLGLVWLLTVKEHRESTHGSSGAELSFKQMISGVVRIRQLWSIGIGIFGFMGCIYAIMGYLPYYLREVGWSAIAADGALAALNLAGAVGALPIALLSDKLGLRKAVILPALIIVCLCTFLLTWFDNGVVWVLAIIVGFPRDGVVALMVTMNQEVAAGSRYAGTALGFQNTLSRGGNSVGPYLGNSLAGIAPGAPFLMWTVFAAIAVVSMILSKETGRKPKET